MNDIETPPNPAQYRYAGRVTPTGGFKNAAGEPITLQVGQALVKLDGPHFALFDHNIETEEPQSESSSCKPGEPETETEIEETETETETGEPGESNPSDSSDEAEPQQ